MKTKSLAFVSGLPFTLLLSACSHSPNNGAAIAANAANGDWKHPVTSWGDPDLTGTWPVYHMITTPLERPARFEGRLRFTEEEIAEQQGVLDNRNTRYEEEDSSDRIGMGHWAEESSLPTQTSLIVDPPDGQLPEQTTTGKEMSKSFGSSWNNKVFDSVADFDGWDRCLSRGLPMSMMPYQYNNGHQIIQAPGYVILNMEMIHEARIVPLGDHPNLDDEIKQYLGNSRGHWEGNTLVVETTNFNGKLSITNSGTGNMLPEHSSSTEMTVTERFERVSDDRINYSITVNDPVTMSSPFTIAFPWSRDNDYEFFEYACHEDNYAVRNYIETSRYERAKGDD